MKILFIANQHLNLYKEIIAELERRHHEVVTILDGCLRFDPYFKSGKFKYIKKKLFVDTYNIYTHYWNNKIKNNPQLSESYDMLLVLSGFSVGKKIINHLKSKNPNIKKVLYTWDSCSYYAYDRLIDFFDRSYTFDIEDAKHNPKWTLLPIYCNTIRQNVDNNTCQYDIFSIGTNHDGRYSFLLKVIPQLKKQGIPYCIRLIDLRKKISLKQKIKYTLVKMFSPANHIDYINEMEFVLKEADKFGIKLNHIISSTEYNDLIEKSSCILDDQRDGQTGLTAKFIWALANKKKIITTNKWSYEYSFVNPKQVFIIDKDNPVIPTDFVKKQILVDECSNVTFLKIENWVNTLLS